MNRATIAEFDGRRSSPTPSGRIVFDIVQHVTPGALTSTPPGDWLVGFHRTEDEANEVAAKCNECRSECVRGSVWYYVVATDDESPDRHRTYADYLLDKSLGLI